MRLPSNHFTYSSESDGGVRRCLSVRFVGPYRPLVDLSPVCRRRVTFHYLLTLGPYLMSSSHLTQLRSFVLPQRYHKDSYSVPLHNYTPLFLVAWPSLSLMEPTLETGQWLYNIQCRGTPLSVKERLRQRNRHFTNLLKNWERKDLRKIAKVIENYWYTPFLSLDDIWNRTHSEIKTKNNKVSSRTSFLVLCKVVTWKIPQQRN